MGLHSSDGALDRLQNGSSTDTPIPSKGEDKDGPSDGHIGDDAAILKGSGRSEGYTTDFIRVSVKIFIIMLILATAVFSIQYYVEKRRRASNVFLSSSMEAACAEPPSEQQLLDRGTTIHMYILPNGRRITRTYREIDAPSDDDRSSSAPSCDERVDSDGHEHIGLVRPPSYKPPRKYEDVPPPSYDSLDCASEGDNTDNGEEREPELPPAYGDVS
ncbi:uncharacterized protein [Ptychodera flava]|uniref:uncharacterized protein n=1 Tax=Ptychodera flava TaxID=63121 RepID=UPI00396A6B6C